jgi:hypothetical protein
MKKPYIIFIILVVLGLLAWVIMQATTEKTPEVPVVPIDDPVLVQPAEKPNLITVSQPLPDSTVSASPLVVKGRARGQWFFEATAPVSLVNWDGLIIGEGYIQVDEGYEWMTTDFVPFTGTITYDASQLGAYKHGWIILKKHNASGEPQFDDALEFKIFYP